MGFGSGEGSALDESIMTLLDGIVVDNRKSFVKVCGLRRVRMKNSLHLRESMKFYSMSHDWHFVTFTSTRS